MDSVSSMAARAVENRDSGVAPEFHEHWLCVNGADLYDALGAAYAGMRPREAYEALLVRLRDARCQ